MRFLEFEVTNWGPHSHQLITFEPNARIIAISGDNDVGKSWMIRGIGFILSTGKNEYGSEADILQGEDFAELRMVFTHRNQKYELKKKVYRKTLQNKEGGNFLELNGEKISPTKLEEIFTDQLGLPPSRISLPICISSQGDTHFYLKAKRRDREEGLRTLTQLDRIDAWKTHLTQKVNTFDKEISDKKLTQESQQNLLKEEIEKIKKENEKLLSEIKYLQEGDENLRWNLKEQLEACQKFEERNRELKRLKNEILNLEEANNLSEQKVQKLLHQQKELPLGELSLEELEEKIEKTNKGISDILVALQWHAFYQKQTEKKATEKELAQVQEELGKLPKIPAKETRQKAAGLLSYLNGKKDKEKKAHRKFEEIEKELQATQAQLKDAETLQLKYEQSQKAIRESRQEIDEFLLHHRIDSSQEIQQIKSQLETHIEDFQNRIINSPITEAEANVLLQRVAHNWDDSQEEHLCPVCAHSLLENPELKTRGARKMLISSLQDTLQGDQQTAPKDNVQNLLEECFQFKSILQKEIPKLESLLKEAQVAKAKAKEKDQDKIRKNIEIIQKEYQTSKIYEETQKEIQEALQELKTLLEVSSIEEAQKILENYSKTELKEVELKTGLQNLQKKLLEKSQEEETLNKDLPEEKPQEIKFLLLQEADEIREEQTKLRKVLKDTQEAKNKRTSLQKEISEAKAKLEANKATIVQKKKEEAKLTKVTPESLGILPLETSDSGEPDWNTSLQLWKEKAETLSNKKAIQSEYPKKEEEKTQALTKTQKELEALLPLFEQLEAAKQLALFLDYKNAPRQLLGLTVEKIITKTNQLAKTFQLGMVLERNKTLDFNVRQTRNGRELIQKSERLGFGKANLLGICMRLATQILLLPEAGFLILDEPGAYISPERKRTLCQFLANLNTLSEDVLPQIIMTEHDPDVLEAANQILPIG